MSCSHAAAQQAGLDTAFTVDASRVTFGRGCLAEAGPRAKALGMKRVALFTDARVAALHSFAAVRASLLQAGLDVVVFSEVRVEPTDASFQAAARFAAEARPDGYLSLGGGSVIDTCKAANLYATWPADFLAYVNAPVGEGRPVPGPLRPHLACPTTSGTGSEVTGITIFDLVSLGAKTGIASPHLRPTEALVDACCTETLPAQVVAASGLDVLSHALESYTARPFDRRPAPPSPVQRPMSQGRNPWSDLGCREALSLLGRYLVRAAEGADDDEAREQVMWAATLAGIAFGNAGVHAPHGMAYAVAGLVRDFRPAGYPQEDPLVPHGMSVILNAPSVFRFTASAHAERHLIAAGALGADVSHAQPADAGKILADRITWFMQRLQVPNGLKDVGYTSSDIPKLVEGTLPQHRVTKLSPRAAGTDELARLFEDAMTAW